MSDLKLLNRYRCMLGAHQAPPSEERLHELVRAQILLVPFENISKLLRFKRTGRSSMVSLEEHLEGIQRHRFGGTCYANNWHFGKLLSHLGYRVAFCGADMTRPDVHTVLIVTLEGREFLVDVGYSAPFFEPIPRHTEETLQIPWGECLYVFHPPDAIGRTRLEMWRNRELVHGYLAKPDPKSADDFAGVVCNSYRPDANFMTALVAERFFDKRSVRIHNFKLIEATPDSHEIAVLDDRQHVVEAVEHHVGIAAEIVNEAIEGIPLEADIYS